jgi:hypothetical protein
MPALRPHCRGGGSRDLRRNDGLPGGLRLRPAAGEMDDGVERERDSEHHPEKEQRAMKRSRRLPVDLSTPMDHQLTTMVIKTVDHFDTVSAGADELDLERQRETDPFRPLALVLLEQANAEIEREKERATSESVVSSGPAQRGSS